MRQGRGLILLAGLLLCGCAVRTPAERMAGDIADCRRHAAEGPGGPSSVVGDTPLAGNVRNSLARTRTGLQQSLTATGPHVSQREIIYRSCLQDRGYAMPHNDIPLDPDTVGRRDQTPNPV